MPPAEHAEPAGLATIVAGLSYAATRPELIGTYVVDIVAMTKGLPPGIPYTDAYVQMAMNHPFLNAIVAVAQHSQFVNALRKLKERREEKALQSDANAVSLAIAE